MARVLNHVVLNLASPMAAPRPLTGGETLSTAGMGIIRITTPIYPGGLSGNTAPNLILAPGQYDGQLVVVRNESPTTSGYGLWASFPTGNVWDPPYSPPRISGLSQLSPGTCAKLLWSAALGYWLQTY